MTVFIARSIVVATLLSVAGSAFGALAHNGAIGASAVPSTWSDTGQNKDKPVP